jgi:predicted transcriptional regulator
VKADEIAAGIDRNPGTIRNAMQGLKSLGLVESVKGPRGGYRPTDAAFETLERDDFDDEETVTLSQDYERVSVTVDEITFPNVFHADECTAHVHFQQSVPKLSDGDPIAVGPTPLSGLVVAGQVKAVNETADDVLVDVAVMEAPLDEA